MRRIYELDYAGSDLLAFLQTYYGERLDPARLDGATYALDACRSCSLVFQRGIPKPDFLDEIYDQWLNQAYHPDQDPAVARDLSRPHQSRDGQELYAVARTVGRPVERLRVLDYGMGWGTWARIAKRLGCEVYGFDLSEARQAFARESGIRVVQPNELEGLELDFVNTEQVFEHLTQPLDDAKRISAGLRTGGILKIAIPWGPFIERRLARPDWYAGRLSPRSLNAVHPLEHLNCWTPRALASMADIAGLSPVSVRARAYLEFLKGPGALDPKGLKQIAKATLRPLYHRFSTWQLYRWFVKR